MTAAFEQVLTRGPDRNRNGSSASVSSERAPDGQVRVSPRSNTQADPEGKAPAADPALRRRESLVHVLLNHHDFVTIR